MTRFMNISGWHLFFLAIAISVINVAAIIVFLTYKEIEKMPIVHFNEQGNCIKVVNIENGHAFNCNDVDVLLRQYKTPLK
jgi:hypothetical protein